MLKSLLSKLEQELKNLATEVKTLASLGSGNRGTTINADVMISVTQRIEKLEQTVIIIQKSLDELRSQQKQSTTINLQETKESIGDESLFRELNSKFNQLRAELDQMKKEFAKWLKEMQDSLNSKADLDALSNLEKSLMERINEIVKALTKQLADKNDTKKALKLLER